MSCSCQCKCPPNVEVRVLLDGIELGEAIDVAIERNNAAIIEAANRIGIRPQTVIGVARPV